MNQHAWVYGCYKYYLENYIEPGNPEDGEWHNCHWPIPSCLGGTKTIPLLREHHAVHGVLQSEEWGTCCVCSWERKYLTGWLLERCLHWESERGKKIWPSLTEEQKKNFLGAQTPEELRENGRKGGLKLSETRSMERKKEIGRLGAEAKLKATTPEERSEAARRMHARRTPEERSAIVKKGHAKRDPNRRESQLWESTVDGYRGRACDVVLHNIRRGWDSDARRKVG